MQPVTHRVPVPKLVIDAVLSVSVAWGWLRFAALTALAFHGAMRIGEPITAVRGDLILPEEAALQQKVCFLRVSKPKPGRRGRGRIQHARIDDEFAVDLAVADYGQYFQTPVGQSDGSTEDPRLPQYHTRRPQRGCSVYVPSFSAC